MLRAISLMLPMLQAVHIASHWVKAHYRLGVALAELGQPRQALQAIRRSLDLAPKNRQLLHCFNSVQEQLRKEQLQLRGDRLQNALRGRGSCLGDRVSP